MDSHTQQEHSECHNYHQAVNELIPGSAKIVKVSEDGKVDGITFRIQGNGIDKTVKTANGGVIQVDNLRPRRVHRNRSRI